MDSQRDADDALVEAEELIALIKAIKFAYEDYGAKRVHDEIKTHGGKYARVPLKRVKKYMQKLGMTQTNSESQPSDEATASEKPRQGGDDRAKVASEDMERKAKAAAKAGAIQLMTVGGKSKSERPDAEATQAADANEHADSDDVWLPVKLDEPATKLSKFPYQAVIRMTNSDEGDATGAMGEIYKIQVAMSEDGTLSDVHPMLVYNKARNRKTFLHPDSPAYAPVLRLIAARGFNGVVGGAKAFFWGRYRQEDDMLYVHTQKLAPFQKW
ncbi:hypothetical protein PINS_up002873 [Pythium insidiosum]|nr:hypothetical protein PINS_up002873 [Pythium insidiosum]